MQRMCNEYRLSRSLIAYNCRIDALLRLTQLKIRKSETGGTSDRQNPDNRTTGQTMNDNKPFAPERIFLHDPCDAFSDDSRGSLETVEWSEERVSDDDIEYVMVKK